jgi:serine beta-lactamase-like protein LACTB
MWDICIQCKSQLSHNPNSVVGFGLGWKITKTMNNIAGGRDLPLVISHSGSAVGASSLLSITPQSSKLKDLKNEATRHTININSNGIVVAIICNLQDVKLSDLGADITKLAYDIFYCNCDESI